MRLMHNDGPAPSYRCDCPTHRERRFGDRVAIVAAGCLIMATLLWVSGVQVYGPALVRWLGW